MNDIHDLAAAYALDALGEAERRVFEAHHPGCSGCSSEVEELREVAARLSSAVEIPPPPDLKIRVMEEIRGTPQLPPLSAEVDGLSDRRRWRTRELLLSAAAAAVVAVVATFGALQVIGDDGALDELIAAPDSVITELAGTDGSLRIVWSPGRDEVAVIGNDLADPGPDRAYALWFVFDEGVAPAGLFAPDGGDVRELLDVADLEPGGWGVTIEPATGSDQPTGEILYQGAI